MNTSELDYHLPKELIAQESVEPRDHSRLLVLDKKSGQITHRHFYDLVEYLKAGDLLVLNDTKVFRARLRAKVEEKEIELFLVRPKAGCWIALVKPRRALSIGGQIQLGEGVAMKVVALPEDGTAIMKSSVSDAKLIECANAHGEIPIPPYIKKQPERLEQYQTIFARETGSVAAPTAAFHFTPELKEKLLAKGVEFVTLTLHVGLGTFMPVKTETLSEHPMHSEWVEISDEAAKKINAAKNEGRRVIAVGTTSTRALEGVAKLKVKSQKLKVSQDTLEAYRGEVNLFITPGFEFKVIDGLITNFHLPKSTLLALVYAFAGTEPVRKAYDLAVQEHYRFFSFGDAMLII